MTVCIATICDGEKLILAASDRMMSWGASMTSETSFKMARIHDRWLAMIAGDDTHPLEPIIRLIGNALADLDSPSTTDVEGAIRTAWKSVKNRRAEDHVLSNYDLTLEEFITEGRALFGDIGFADLRAQIDQISQLSCELLVCGFDRRDRPRLYVVVHPGEPVEFSRLGFAAIGSGRDSAIASLMTNPRHKSFASPESGLYRICAAKFMAESALGVGQSTAVGGLSLADGGFTVDFRHVEKVRVLWEKYGRPKLPPVVELLDLEKTLVDKKHKQLNQPILKEQPAQSPPKDDPQDRPPSQE